MRPALAPLALAASGPSLTSHGPSLLSPSRARREYPGTNGADGNQVSSADTANMLKFLQAMRTALPQKLLSTCTTQSAYVGADGSPLTDVSAFAKVLDHILVMNYDVWGGASRSFPRRRSLPPARAAS